MFNIASTNDCFLVFVGGKYVDMLYQVASKVEIIGKKILSKAKVFFLDTNDKKMRYMKETYPPLVKILFTIKIRFLIESLKVYYPNYKNGIGYTFTFQCPNQDNQLTMSLLHNATVRGDIHYYDLCKVADSVTIAYDHQRGFFEIDQETQTLVEFPLVPADGWWLFIPIHWEIIKPFLDHHSLNSTWIDCNSIWGMLDEETEAWTGAVGKVTNLILNFLS